MSHRHLTSLLIAVTLAAGCGELDDPDRTIVVTITGALEANSGVVVDDEVHVALVWFTPQLTWNGTSDAYSVAQEAIVEPRFPASFELTLTDLPPESAIVSGAATPMVLLDPKAAEVRAAIGAVIAYVDVNGNGRLDLLSTDDTESVDRVVAATSETSIVFVEGDPPPLSFLQGQLVTGFNFVVTEDCALIEGGSCGYGAEVRPIAERLILTLDEAPKLDRVLCETYIDAGSDVVEVSGEGPAPTASEPIGFDYVEDMRCSDGGRRLERRLPCAPVPGAPLCQSQSERCVVEVWDLPEDSEERVTWPCYLYGSEWCDAASVANRCPSEDIEAHAQLELFVTGFEYAQRGGMAADGDDVYVIIGQFTDAANQLLRVSASDGTVVPLYVAESGWMGSVEGVSDGRVRWLDTLVVEVDPPEGVPHEEWMGLLVESQAARVCDLAVSGEEEPRCVDLPGLIGLAAPGAAWFTTEDENGGATLWRRPLDGGVDVAVAQADRFDGFVVGEGRVYWLNGTTGAVESADFSGGAHATEATPSLGAEGVHTLVHVDAEAIYTKTADNPDARVATVTRHPRAGGDANEMVTLQYVSGTCSFADDGLYWVSDAKEVLRTGWTGDTDSVALLYAGPQNRYYGDVLPIAVGTSHVYWLGMDRTTLYRAPRL
ncbi:MAG: hypothetical protein EP329_08180 [Deltaproteobacteria bacterium]|nr:MAG: hypothetical protein EP329_08180 [Deltaproteobacteria bacterium]